MTEADWTELEELARRPRVVGVGETGLDYHYDHSPREAAAAAYRRFVALARAAGRPMVSHVRDAHDDAAAILRDGRRPAAASSTASRAAWPRRAPTWTWATTCRSPAS